jgi:hypothetical protein
MKRILKNISRNKRVISVVSLFSEGREERRRVRGPQRAVEGPEERRRDRGPQRAVERTEGRRGNRGP